MFSTLPHFIVAHFTELHFRAQGCRAQGEKARFETEMDNVPFVLMKDKDTANIIRK